MVDIVGNYELSNVTGTCSRVDFAGEFRNPDSIFRFSRNDHTSLNFCTSTTVDVNRAEKRTF
jgi:hypothetical protein